MLGAEAGHNLISGDSTNPKGFWENSEIVDIHHQLLEQMGSSWDDISPLPEGWWDTDVAGAYANRIREVLERDFSAARLGIIKDPRTCRFLPLWLRIFSELGWDPVFVLTLRHPLEVAQSLQKRDHIDPDWGCLLWLNYTVSAEHWTRGRRRALVLYPDLLENWRAAVRAVADELSLPLFPASELAEREVDSFLDPSLRHQATVNEDDASRPPCKLAVRVYHHMVSGRLAPGSDAAMDSLVREVETLQQIVGPWDKQLRRTRERLWQQQARLARIRKHPVLGGILRFWGRFVNPGFRDG